MSRVTIDTFEFDNVTMQETVDRILELTRTADHPQLVCTCNLDHMVTLDQDPEFRDAYRYADLILADGMPIVWISRWLCPRPLRERVAGSDLLWELARASESRGLRLFFLGGAPGAAELAKEAVHQRYPGAQITGMYCPSFEKFNTTEEQERIHSAIEAAAPEVLMVALGAPKQEKWVMEARHRLKVPVSIGVGGSLEMAGGMVRRAPRWMQRTGLEWVYRMVQEPRRMWRRYMGRDLPFFFRLVYRAWRSPRATVSAEP